jgi:transketolase
MVKTQVIPEKEFARVARLQADKHSKLALIADMCRANTLASVKIAGSGHLGSSFSSLDIVTYLYYSEMDVARTRAGDPNRDIYFSSKGHDVPGLYAVLFSLGLLPKEKFLRLRRIDGPFGHPDVSTPGIEANSGSLGMGVSKAKGMAWAKRWRGLKGRVFVMTGDGELQEGQIWEALQTAVHQRINNLYVIVDHNKVQSDKLVREIVDLGDMEAKLRAFGWHVIRCDGHDFSMLEDAFRKLNDVTDKPKILIADTIKGHGVSFMEHPRALSINQGLYPWHAGAPNDGDFSSAYDEITARIGQRAERIGAAPILSEQVPPDHTEKKSTVTGEYVSRAYGEALLSIAATREDLVVLGADLSADCQIREFEIRYPLRFIENGIAEQDMVSMAGSLARQGLLPVVNSFASFLVARANEQIYNNATEGSKVIYACHYAGLIPAGPGKSHQSLRDISLLGALPNMVILQPCNSTETYQAVKFAVEEACENVALRLAIGPSPRRIELPKEYRLTPGRGIALTQGDDAVLFAYGPVMLHEALLASELLNVRGFGLKVVNMPWLNRVDVAWLVETISPFQKIFVLDDHAPVGGLGDFLLDSLVKQNHLGGRRYVKFGIEGYPACGRPFEVLDYHRISGSCLAERILQVGK